MHPEKASLPVEGSPSSFSEPDVLILRDPRESLRKCSLTPLRGARGVRFVDYQPALRLIASISVSNLGNLVLPEQMGRLVIIGENDAPGSKADEATRTAIVRHQAQGREVALINMPTGAKDANDVLRGSGQQGEMAA